MAVLRGGGVVQSRLLEPNTFIVNQTLGVGNTVNGAIAVPIDVTALNSGDRDLEGDR